MRAFTSVDITGNNCKVVLKELIANSDGQSTWIVTRLMMRLRQQDEYFDYRIHYDKNDEVDIVTWQTGNSRGSFEHYYTHIFLDVRHNENMNTIGMKYMSIVGIDPNHQFYPASESFVFAEENDLYGLGCKYTIDMTPGVSAGMVVFGFGDYFLSQSIVREWFPNILFSVDVYHFCSGKNKTNVLLKDFGPKVWGQVSAHMINAVYAETEGKCLVSTILLNIFFQSILLFCYSYFTFLTFYRKV